LAVAGSTPASPLKLILSEYVNERFTNMNDISAIEKIESQLLTATNFVMIFGPLSTTSPVGRLKELRQKFAYLAKMVHPDAVPNDLEGRSSEVFKKLLSMREAAEVAICEGIYEEPFKKTFALRSKHETYQCDEDSYKKGDFSLLYKARNSKDENVLIKISSKPSYNPWLEKERIFVRKNKDKYIPGIIDSFFITDNGRRYQVLVMPYVEGYVSITDILNAYPDGLDPRDAAWIGRRIMGQVVLAKELEVVHTSIIPDHLLVNVHSHDPLHIGWGHSIKEGEKLSLIISKWKDNYPPEVFDKKRLDEKTDVFMAGQMMVSLFGKNKYPESVRKVLLKSIDLSPSKRPDAVKTLSEFTYVIRNEWGKKYRKFKMP